MAKNLNHWALQFSQKIFAGLLRAYPSDHRREFGAAMSQFFRDQCRDAWNKSRGWGLFKLWLRVLPDLLKTSIWERIVNLNHKSSMTEKIANLSPSPASTFFRVAIPVFLATVLASVAITFILPETYSSTARVLVKSDETAGKSGTLGYDPYFVQTTFEIMQSEVVLSNVIARLDLNNVWSRKYGTTLQTADTLKILRGDLLLSPVRNTQLINIKVLSENPNEAAKIANAIADVYVKYRTDLRLGRLKAKDKNLNAQTPLPTLAQITDTAEPGKSPVRPNKPLNIFIGVVAGAFLGLAIGAIVLILSKWRNRGGNVATA